MWLSQTNKILYNTLYILHIFLIFYNRRKIFPPCVNHTTSFITLPLKPGTLLHYLQLYNVHRERKKNKIIADCTDSFQLCSKCTRQFPHTQEDKVQSVPESLESRKPLTNDFKQASQILWFWDLTLGFTRINAMTVRPLRKPGILLILMYKFSVLRHTGVGIYTST